MNSIIKIIDRFEAGFQAPKDSQQPPKDAVAVLPIPYVIASSWLLDKPITKTTSVGLEIEIRSLAGKSLAKQTQKVSGLPVGASRISINLRMEQLISLHQSDTYTLKATLHINDKQVADAEYVYEVQLNAQEV